MEFMIRIYFGGQCVAANKRIIVMSWISLLCEFGLEKLIARAENSPKKSFKKKKYFRKNFIDFRN